MSLRKRIDQNCKECIYDQSCSGTWRQQVSLCTIKSYQFWNIRAKPTSPIPDSTLSWHGVDLANLRP